MQTQFHMLGGEPHDPNFDSILNRGDFCMGYSAAFDQLRLTNQTRQQHLACVRLPAKFDGPKTGTRYSLRSTALLEARRIDE